MRREMSLGVLARLAKKNRNLAFVIMCKVQSFQKLTPDCTLETAYIKRCEKLSHEGAF